MDRLSILFFNLCFFAALVGSIHANSSATTETSKTGAYDMRGDKIHHADLKSVENDPECRSMNENHVKDAAQLEQHSAKGSSYLNKTTNAFTASVVHSASSSIDDTRHSEYIGDQKDDVSRSDRKEESVDLSHDILLDPSLMPARPARQAEKGEDYTTASIEDIPDESHGNVESRSIDSSLQSSDLEGDLSVAEDRYQSQYPYYRGQFPNQRYRTNDRREPYRSYLRYPVFPGK